MSTATPPDTTQLARRGDDLAAQLDAIRIPDIRAADVDTIRTSRARAVELRNVADDFLKEVEKSLGPIVKAAHEAHRKAVAERDRLKAPAETLKADAGALGWSCDQELRRRQDEADRQARQDQERIEREAEAQRQFIEAAARKVAEDQRIAAAVELEAQGDTVAAGRLLEAPVEVARVEVPPVFVPPAPVIATKVEGASFGTAYDFEVVSPASVKGEYLIPDLRAIGTIVRRMGKRAEAIVGGIRVVEKARTARR